MRVVVADDVMLTREGIVRLLGDAGVDVVGQASDAHGLIRLVERFKPDVAVVDIRMPPTHTDEGLRPPTDPLRTPGRRGARAVAVHRGGVCDAAARGSSRWRRLPAEGPHLDVAVLVDALRRIVDGESVIDPTIVSRLVGRRRRDDPLHELTEREREVLELVAEGLSNGPSPPACSSPSGPSSRTRSRSSQARARNRPGLQSSCAGRAGLPAVARPRDGMTQTSASGIYLQIGRHTIRSAGCWSEASTPCSPAADVVPSISGGNRGDPFRCKCVSPDRRRHPRAPGTG